jgi:hypothetical protein
LPLLRTDLLRLLGLHYKLSVMQFGLENKCRIAASKRDSQILRFLIEHSNIDSKSLDFVLADPDIAFEEFTHADDGGQPRGAPRLRDLARPHPEIHEVGARTMLDELDIATKAREFVRLCGPLALPVSVHAYAAQIGGTWQKRRWGERGWVVLP